MIITRFKSYPYRDKNRGHTVIESTDMSHTKPKPNTTKGKRKTLAKQKQGLLWDLKSPKVASSRLKSLRPENAQIAPR